MMASVCINSVAMSPENFLDCPTVQHSQGWLSPRLSFSRDLVDDAGKDGDETSDRDDSVMDFADFEFRLSDPVAMMSADELFSNGKLVPLHLAQLQPAEAERQLEIRSPASSMRSRRGEKDSGPNQFYSYSPKAPRCSGVWKELLRLKKAQGTEAELQKAASDSASASSKVSNAKSLKHFLRLNPRSPSNDSAHLTFPQVRDADSESVFASARASLSSSSSSAADHDDPPRLSLDSDKVAPLPASLCRIPSRDRLAKARPPAFRRPSELSAEGNITAMRSGQNSTLGASESECDDLLSPLRALVDSPRLNASGKVIFQGLGRSSSSPSIFNGGPRPRPRGMERSWSANVVFTPVLNVPVRSLRSPSRSVSVSGFGQLFSHNKREKELSSSTKNAVNNSNTVAKTKCEKPASRD